MADALWMWFKHDAVLLLSLAVIFPIDNRIEYYAFCYKYIFPEFNSKNVNYYSRSYFKIAVQGTREREMINEYQRHPPYSRTTRRLRRKPWLESATLFRLWMIVSVVPIDAMQFRLHSKRSKPDRLISTMPHTTIRWNGNEFIRGILCLATTVPN